MAHNEELLQKIGQQLAGREQVQEIRMFHGKAFMLAEKLLLCISADGVLFRVDPLLQEELFVQKGARPMEMRGRSVKGYWYVSAAELQKEQVLHYWLDLALAYNKVAKAGKRKKAPPKI